MAFQAKPKSDLAPARQIIERLRSRAVACVKEKDYNGAITHLSQVREANTLLLASEVGLIHQNRFRL